MTANPGPRHEQRQAPHQRPPDPAEEAGLPLVDKASPNFPDPDRDPHAALNNPVGEPDPTADSDPYTPAPDDEDQ